FFGREVFRQFREPPLRHARDGPREVHLRLSVQEEEPEEGAQSSYHQPGHSGTARVGMSQEEMGDIVGGQIPDTDQRIPEAFDEETADVAPVPGGRYRSETAFFLEVVLVLSAECRQRGFVRRRLWRANIALLTQVLQEVTSGPTITFPEAPFAPSFFEEPV